MHTDYHAGGFAHQRQRGEILQRVIGQLRMQCRVGGMRTRRQQIGVTVGGGPRHHLGANDAVGTGPVVDDDLLAQDIAHALTEHATDRIRRPACCPRHDEAD